MFAQTFVKYFKNELFKIAKKHLVWWLSLSLILWSVLLQLACQESL